MLLKSWGLQSALIPFLVMLVQLMEVPQPLFLLDPEEGKLDVRWRGRVRRL